MFIYYTYTIKYNLIRNWNKFNYKQEVTKFEQKGNVRRKNLAQVKSNMRTYRETNACLYRVICVHIDTLMHACINHDINKS